MSIKVEIEIKGYWLDLTPFLTLEGRPPLPGPFSSSADVPGVYPDDLIESGDTTTPHWYDLLLAIQDASNAFKREMDKATTDQAKKAWEDKYNSLRSFFDGRVHGIRITCPDNYIIPETNGDVRVLIESRYTSRNA